MAIPRVVSPFRYAGDGPGPFAATERDRPLRVLIDLPAGARRIDDSTKSWDQLGVPRHTHFLWSLCMREEIETYCMGEEGIPAKGRVSFRHGQAGDDQLLFTTEGEDGVVLRGIWPYHQWESAALELAAREGTDQPAALEDLLVAAVGRKLRVDVLATNRESLLDGRIQATHGANAMPVDQALAVVGLYLRSLGLFPILAPDILQFGEHLMRWVTVRAKLPAG